ncbi:MAG: hypothetical protein ACRC7R_01520 [Sarcina sp.]
MNEKNFNEQEYLKACLIRDMLNAKGMVATYVNITEVMKKEKERLQQEVEDWKHKCRKLEEELEKKSETIVNISKEDVKGVKNVMCVDKGDFNNLTYGKIYDVIKFDERHYKIIADNGEKVWFYKIRFKVVPF